MCAIAGLWQPGGPPPDVAPFADAMSHRGPDGLGLWTDEDAGLALGHRRLAILDLSDAGRQPMSDGEGRYRITYNGELYNFLELRAELETLGRPFRSQSDTEVILAAYAQWGEACQLKFNGMWAFAIWDRKEQALFLSRDRFGVKPLHYFFDRGRFAFASELKAFLRLPWGAPDFDPRAVAAALADSTSLEGTEATLLRGVRRLRGGCCLKLSRGKTPEVRRWWRTSEHLPEVPAGLKAQGERFRELFLDACRVRMRSDVPLGTALSGGLDSSSVLCSMARVRAGAEAGPRLAADWQRAFVATFPGTHQDERRWAEQAASAAGARAVYLEVDPAKAIDDLPRVVYDFEDIGDLAVSPWLVYRELRRAGVVVSLDGHGGDELLAGYHRYAESELWGALWPLPRPERYAELRSTLEGLASEGEHAVPSAAALAKRAVSKSLSRWPRARRALRGAARSLGLSDPPDASGWLRAEPPPAPSFDDDPAPEGADTLNRALYRDFHHTVLPTILRNFDRCSMAHGVEIRAPFLDYRLVSFAFSLPSSSKLGGGTTKRVLREAMRGVLPEAIRTRRSKIGFSSPVADWLRGPLKGYVLDSVGSRASLDSQVWDGPALKSYVEAAFQEARYGDVRRVWPIVQAAELMQTFSNHAPKT